MMISIRQAFVVGAAPAGPASGRKAAMRVVATVQRLCAFGLLLPMVFWLALVVIPSAERKARLGSRPTLRK